MPTYEYRCPDGHEFEMFFRKMSDAAAAVAEPACPTCGKPATRKISSGAGLLFKGSGFYLTDYGKNAHRGEAVPTAGKSGESGGAETKAAESNGGESKPSDSKSTESKAADAKPSETKSADAKSRDTKSGEGKSSSSPTDKPKTSSGASTPKSDK